MLIIQHQWDSLVPTYVNHITFLILDVHTSLQTIINYSAFIIQV